MVLVFCHAVRCIEIQLAHTVDTVRHPGEQAPLARLGPPPLVLPQFLAPLPRLPLYDRRVCVREYLPLLGENVSIFFDLYDFFRVLKFYFYFVEFTAFLYCNGVVLF